MKMISEYTVLTNISPIMIMTQLLYQRTREISDTNYENKGDSLDTKTGGSGQKYFSDTISEQLLAHRRSLFVDHSSILLVTCTLCFLN
jgi:hypothetical protein